MTMNDFEVLPNEINIKVFFTKQDPDQKSLTYNIYGVIAKRQIGKVLHLLKNNGEEVLINWDNINMICTI